MGGDVPVTPPRFGISEVFLVEGPIEDNGLEATFEMTKDEDGDDLAIATLMRNGSKVGHIRAVRNNDVRAYQILGSEIDDPSLHGKGIGTQLYLRFHEWIKGMTGLPLASDKLRSAQAEALWQKLSKMGKARPRIYDRIKQKNGTKTRTYYVMQ